MPFRCRTIQGKVCHNAPTGRAIAALSHTRTGAWAARRITIARRRTRVSTRIYALPVETTRWNVPGMSHVAFDWEYDEGRSRLLDLYEKGKAKQWNAKDRIDWSLDVDVQSKGFKPDEYMPIFGSPLWEIG